MKSYWLARAIGMVGVDDEDSSIAKLVRSRRGQRTPEPYHTRWLLWIDRWSIGDPSLTVDYDAREAVSVQEAVAWANQQRCPVALYLYDLGGGFADSEHFNEVANRFPDGGASTQP